MKICQCGAIVPGSSRSGQTCPKCGSTWVEAGRSRPDKYKVLKTIVILLIILGGPAFLILKSVVNDIWESISEKHLNSVMADVSSMWISGRADSVAIAAKIIYV